MIKYLLYIILICLAGWQTTVAQEGNAADTTQADTSLPAETAQDGQAAADAGAEARSIERGETLFVNNCKACHQLDSRLVGPPLSGVTERREHDWLVNFIKSSQSMVQAGDSVAVALFNEYNKVIMPDQPLSPEEIDDVLAYIRTGGQIPGEAVAEHRISRPAQASDGSTLRPMKFSDYRFWLLFTVTVLLLIAVVYFKAETDELKEKTAQSRE